MAWLLILAWAIGAMYVLSAAAPEIDACPNLRETMLTTGFAILIAVFWPVAMGWTWWSEDQREDDEWLY